MSTEQPRTSKRKKKVVAVVAGVAVLGTAGVAYAYWTTSGAGTGTASAGDIQPVTVVQTSVLNAMYPGDTAQTLSGTFNNPNPGNAYVTSVTVTIASVTKAGNPVVGCDATDYTLANTTVAVNQDVATGTAKGSWTGPTIKFNNKATNQDACKNATVNLAYTSA